MTKRKALKQSLLDTKYYWEFTSCMVLLPRTSTGMETESSNGLWGWDMSTRL